MPVGNAGRGAGTGGRVTARGATTGPARTCPAPPTTTEPSPTAPAPRTKVRRAAAGCGSVDACSQVCAGDLAVSPSPSAGEGAGARGDRPVTSSARSASQGRTTSPVIQAASEGTTANGPPPPEASAASPATAARAVSANSASWRRRRARTPIAAASAPVTIATLPRRTGLSAVPRVETAQSFRAGGEASMTREPTANTGDVAGSVHAATR